MILACRAEDDDGIVVVMASMQPKLLDQVREAIRMRHYSRRTEEAYTHWIRTYIVFHRKAHPSSLGAADVTAFVSWLAVDRQVSASTQNQALSAVLFLYRSVLSIDLGSIPPVVRARTPERLPVVLSRDEVMAVLQRLSGVMQLVATLLDGAGLRLQECLELRVKDIDFERGQIVVRQGKGGKDRATVLPTVVKGALQSHFSEVRRIHDADCARGLGRVHLPFAIARKAPSAAADWRWQFVFPASRICRDLRFGSPSHYHLHESVVQKAVGEESRGSTMSGYATSPRGTIAQVACASRGISGCLDEMGRGGTLLLSGYALPAARNHAERDLAETVSMTCARNHAEWRRPWSARIRQTCKLRTGASAESDHGCTRGRSRLVVRQTRRSESWKRNRRHHGLKHTGAVLKVGRSFPCAEQHGTHSMRVARTLF